MLAERGRRATRPGEEGMSVLEKLQEKEKPHQVCLPSLSQITAPGEEHARGWVRAMQEAASCWNIFLCLG